MPIPPHNNNRNTTATAVSITTAAVEPMQQAAMMKPRLNGVASSPMHWPCSQHKPAPRMPQIVHSSSNGNGVVSQAGAVKSPAMDEQVVYAPSLVFSCPEESLFYSQCLQKVLGEGYLTEEQPTILEFGAGDGSPVIDALLKVNSFSGKVHGFELNPRAAGLARARCQQLGLTSKYQVHDSCFFEGADTLMKEAAGATWLVANPPYLPAPDRDIMMPELHGGIDGASLTNDLLALGFPNAMLLVSSFSNPLSTIHQAKTHGYSVTDFLVTPLPFGLYSSEPKVKSWIRQLKQEGKAFFSERPGRTSGGSYLLAGVLFQKRPGARTPAASTNGVAVQVAEADVSDELTRVLTAL